MRLIGNGGIRTISPKKHELWQFVDVDGVRRQRTRTFYGGKIEARAALRAFQNELAESVGSTDVFGAYASSWLEWIEECGRYSAATVMNYRSAIRIICEYIGDATIADIDAKTCKNALVAIKRDRGLTGTSLALKHAVLSSCLESAVGDGVIPRNPMRGIKQPANDTKERDALSPEQMDDLWKEAEKLPLDGCSMSLFLAVDAGLRVGECITLETRDVSEDAIRVSKSKTKAGTGRMIPLTRRLREKCREWELIRSEWGVSDAERYCCKRNGLSLHRQYVHDWYAKVRSRIGAPNRFHDLRHSNLSKMARYMSAHDLQRWAGWSNLSMAQRYVHDDFSQLEAAVRRAENVG